MKPLLQTQLSTFLERFNYFKDAECRSLEILSANLMQLTLATQDSARAFDWITVTFEFSGIEDARLLQENQLSLVDMSDGITIMKSEQKFAFALGECYNISAITNSSCYLLVNSIKYQEGQF